MTIYFQKRIQGPEIFVEDAVASHINKLFISNSKQSITWTAGSLKVGAGVPDLLSATFLPEVTALAESESIDISIISYLRSVRCAHQTTIAERIRQPSQTVTHRLEKLSSLDIVNSSKESYSLAPQWRNILTEVVCVEAKVTNWKVALAQATHNLIFAHKSYVALPEKTAKRIKSDEEFKKYGIGLLSVQPNGSVEIIRRARTSTPKVWFYYFQIATRLALDISRCHHAI